MLRDDRDILEVLKFELQFLEDVGYGHSVRTPRQPKLTFEDYHATKLRDHTAAILVGEPTGGKPNCYGDVRLLELPNSRIRVAYSTKYFKLRVDDTPSLMPDILVEQTSKDFFAGVDPVLSAIRR